MLIILIGIAVLNLIGLALLAKGLGNVSIEIAGLREDVARFEDRVISRVNALGQLTANFHDMNLSAHRVTRRYLGTELIIGKLFPAVGYKEPVKSEIEQALIAQIGQEMSEAAAKQSQ